MKQRPRWAQLAWATILLAVGLVGSRAHAGPLIQEITTDKARYAPRKHVTILVRLDNPTDAPLKSGRISFTCTHLDTMLPSPRPQRVSLRPGETRTLTFTWTPPATDFQGYGVFASLRDSRGLLRDRTATAVDVSSRWTRFPRYGFLSGFPRQLRPASQREVRQLRDFHLNGLQFYDWQFKHHVPLAGTVAHPAAAWNDIANRPTARQTLLDLIAEAHRAGMAAMNYNLIYGARSGYSADGVDDRWGLWKQPGAATQDGFDLPAGWATPRVFLFNPADPGWQRYLLDREAEVFAAYPFDGWQVDQLGERGPEFDFTGHPVTVWQTFRPFLNAAKRRLRKTLIFNNVGAYGLFDTCAHSTEDAIYVECWEDAGQKTYQDLKTVIDQAGTWSHGKSVILAAYMDRSSGTRYSRDHPGRFNTPGVLLTDATIFAAGGAHIELGDGAEMLSNEYFPNHNLVPSDDLRTTLRHYYDFQVAYENVLRGDGLTDTSDAITLNVPMSRDGTPNTVWTFTKSNAQHQVLHLINLRGETRNAWRDDRGDDPVPTPQTHIVVTDYAGDQPITKVGWASPDDAGGQYHPLAFQNGTDRRGRYVRFTIPRLAYWDMILISRKSVGTLRAGVGREW